MVEFRKNREIFDFLYRKIEGAKETIHVAVAWFTDPELSKILLEKKNQNVEIKIILYNDEINSLLKNIKSFGDDLYFSNTLLVNYIMHHKFCIIDNEVVITGSYNWTVKARRFNRENVLCVSNKNIVDEFNFEFENLLKNSTPQSRVDLKIIPNSIEKVEDVELLNLEKAFNEEIYSKIDDTADLKIGVDIDLAYNLVRKHTPVIASKKLAESNDGKTIQSGLRKLTEANKLFLSFEESIIKFKYKALFNRETRELAYEKLKILGFFSNEIYSNLWEQYLEPQTM